MGAQKGFSLWTDVAKLSNTHIWSIVFSSPMVSKSILIPERPWYGVKPFPGSSLKSQELLQKGFSLWTEYGEWERIKENCTKAGQEWRDNFMGEKGRITIEDASWSLVDLLYLSLALWPWWHQIMNKKKWENKNESQDQVWWIENICDSRTGEVDCTDSARLTGACLLSKGSHVSKVTLCVQILKWR